MLQHQKSIADLDTASIFINQSDEFTPFEQSSSKNKKISKQTKAVQRWMEEEKILYLRFLKINQQRIAGMKPKAFNLFVKMSDFIESKTPNQCRSNHQKVMKKFGTLEIAIKNYAPNKLTSKTDYFPKKKIQTSTEESISKQKCQQFSTKSNQEKYQLSNRSQKQLHVLSWDDNIFDVLA